MLSLVRDEKLPRLNSYEAESAATQYLEIEFRSQGIDRVLVDLLVASVFIPVAEDFLLGFRIRLRGFAVLLGFLTLTLLAFYVGYLGSFWTELIVGGCIFLIGLRWLDARLSRGPTGEQKLLRTEAMYESVKSDGFISARHIREKASKTEEFGVVWPPTLFVLLDDIESRTGRF